MSDFRSRALKKAVVLLSVLAVFPSTADEIRMAAPMIPPHFQVDGSGGMADVIRTFLNVSVRSIPPLSAPVKARVSGWPSASGW